MVGQHLKKFFVGLIGTSAIVAMTTLYAWVIYAVATSIWRSLDRLVSLP